MQSFRHSPYLFIFPVISGIYFGYFGSMVLFLSWPLAIIFGWAFEDAVTSRGIDLVSTKYVVPYFAIGLVIGGLLGWGMFCSLFEFRWWVNTLLLSSTGILFFCSAMINRYFFHRNTKHDENPSSGNRVLHHVFQSFKPKKGGNDQYLETVNSIV